MHPEQIFNLLTQEYSLILATTSQDFEAVKQIRKEVFSSKYSMSPSQLKSIGFLYNKDDKQSFIYLLRHNVTNKYVGTVRTCFINKRTPIQKLPMQKDAHVNNIEYLTKNLPICEISRLALSNTLINYKKISALQLRTYLAIALMTATRINFFLYHYHEIFAFMEIFLYRILKRQNVNFKKISEPIDSYGIRIPFAIERKKLLRDTEGSMGKITRYYLKQLCQNPEPFWQFIDNNPYLERSDIQLDRICKLFKDYGDDVDLELLLSETKDNSTS